MSADVAAQAELVPIDDLRPHPRNYQVHPDDQLEHLVQSIREHGFYRNVVATRDGTILAGHGAVEAARRAGLTDVPVFRIDVEPDDPRALKILTGDNAIASLSEVDDRLLTEMLREISAADTLLGTGYDDLMLASLVLVTRSEHEIPNVDAAAEWAGMPEFETFASAPKVVVSFANGADREKFLDLVGLSVFTRKDRETWSTRWPPQEKEDLSSLFFEAGGDPDADVPAPAP